MASFNTMGLDGLQLSLEQLADLPDGVLLDMLQAEGEVVKASQESVLAGHRESGQLERSVTVGRELKRDWSGKKGIFVYPDGIRQDGRTRNAEVGFVLEYGAPRRGLPATQWMRFANAKAEEEAARAAEKVYSDWLDSLGL